MQLHLLHPGSVCSGAAASRALGLCGALGPGAGPEAAAASGHAGLGRGAGREASPPVVPREPLEPWALRCCLRLGLSYNPQRRVLRTSLFRAELASWHLLDFRLGRRRRDLSAWALLPFKSALSASLPRTPRAPVRPPVASRCAARPPTNPLPHAGPSAPQARAPRGPSAAPRGHYEHGAGDADPHRRPRAAHGHSAGLRPRRPPGPGSAVPWALLRRATRPHSRCTRAARRDTGDRTPRGRSWGPGLSRRVRAAPRGPTTPPTPVPGRPPRPRAPHYRAAPRPPRSSGEALPGARGSRPTPRTLRATRTRTRGPAAFDLRISITSAHPGPTRAAARRLRAWTRAHAGRGGCEGRPAGTRAPNTKPGGGRAEGRRPGPPRLPHQDPGPSPERSCSCSGAATPNPKPREVQLQSHTLGRQGHRGETILQVPLPCTPVGEPPAWSTPVSLLNPAGTAQGSSIGLREQLLENFYPDTGVPRPLSVALKVPQEEKKRRCRKFHVHQHEKVIR
ncbi:uncharacterized protein AAEQ78_005863 [Lycaon pictus]